MTPTSSPVPSPPARGTAWQAVITFLVVTILASGLFWSSRLWSPLHQNLHALIAVLFFYAPVVAERWRGRRFDFETAGLRSDPLRTNLAILGLALALTFPLFIAAFFAFYQGVCSLTEPAWPHTVVRLRQLCPSAWLGWAGGHVHLTWDIASLAFSQVVVVALPEELFFRGYLMGELEAAWPSRRQVLGAPVGRALWASAALFALGHLLVDFNPQRLAVFFPGLVFGWMRSRTGSLAAGAIFHALCNVLSEVLHTGFFAHTG